VALSDVLPENCSIKHIGYTIIQVTVVMLLFMFCWAVWGLWISILANHLVENLLDYCYICFCHTEIVPAIWLFFTPILFELWGCEFVSYVYLPENCSLTELCSILYDCWLSVYCFRPYIQRSWVTV